jgi:hypothetical protein
VDARHEIEPLEHIVRIVRRAIRQNIGFGTLQDPEVKDGVNKDAANKKL